MSINKTEKSNVNKETCFVITPYGGWFDHYYDKIYRPAIEAGGLIAIRADDLYRSGIIINDIWKFTQDARIILADLTHKSPNVLYELGLAHALAKPAILITEAIDDIPFDLRSLRVLMYDKNKPDWGGILKNKITKAIKEVLKAPLKAVLPTFLEIKPESKGEKITETEKAILELRQEMDALRRDVLSSREIEILDNISGNKDGAVSLFGYPEYVTVPQFKHIVKPLGLFELENDDNQKEDPKQPPSPDIKKSSKK